MVYAKTSMGQQVIKDRSVPLSPRQRSALIMIDGKRKLDEVLAATAAMGVTREDIEQMASLGLIEATAAPAPAPAPGAHAGAGAGAGTAPAPKSNRTDQERYAEAYPIAVKLTGGLGLRGFRLNLAVEAAGNYTELVALAPKIRDAVGPGPYAPLAAALEI